ncbi:MAG: insulinase family protein [Alphaproteobacteria bacterium]|nr:insulinase family protein [Alphaproteobacteria bacterium]
MLKRYPLMVVAFFFAAVLTAPSRAQPPKAFQFVLQNGLQVVVVPDHRAPVVTQMLVYKVGAVDDPPGTSGLAHFFEHMMFRGTKSVPGEGFSQTIARNGGDDNAFTTRDYTVFHEQVSRDKLRLVMHLEADRMANLDLSDSAVATERDVVLEERRLRVDIDPAALTEEQADAALYLSHPYGRPIVGWPDEIRHIGRSEADDFYKHHYAPNNAILIEVGDVTVDDVRAVAESEFGTLPARELQPRADYAQPPRLGETRLAIIRPDAKVPMLLRIYRVPSYGDAAPGRAEALEVLARLLGGDATSVLYRKLVVERHMATDVSVTYDGYRRDAGAFSISVQPRPGASLDAVERAMDDALAPYLKRAPNKAELARAKALLIAGATFRRDSPFDMAQAYAGALGVGLTPYDVQQWPSRIQAVAPKDVLAAASADLVRPESVTATLTPAK